VADLRRRPASCCAREGPAARHHKSPQIKAPFLLRRRRRPVHTIDDVKDLATRAPMEQTRNMQVIRRQGALGYSWREFG
jgi:hypothetical protein